MNTLNLNDYINQDYLYNNDQIKQSLDVILAFVQGKPSRHPLKQDLRILKYSINLFESQGSKLSRVFTKDIYEELKKHVQDISTCKNQNAFLHAIKKIVLKESFSLSDISSDDESEWNIVGKTTQESNPNPAQNSSHKPSSILSRKPARKALEKIDDQELGRITAKVGGFIVVSDRESPPEDEASVLDIVYQSKEMLIVTQFGQAMFNDYVPDLFICLKKSIYDLVEDKYLLEQIRLLLETHVAAGQEMKYALGSNNTFQLSMAHLSTSSSVINPFKESHADLLNLTLLIQTKSCIQGLREIIQNIVKNPQYRSQFPALLFAAIPAHMRKTVLEKMGPELFQLVQFFIRSYLPEIFDASLVKIQELLQEPKQAEKLEHHLSAFLGKQRGNIDVDVVELVAYLILNHILEPVEEGFNVFARLLKEEGLNQAFKKHLEVVIQNRMYSTPGPVNSETKRMLLHILKSIHNFFKAVNHAKMTCDSLKMTPSNPEKTYAEMVYQNLAGSLLDAEVSTHIDALDKNIRFILEEICWKYLYPGISKTSRNASLSEKMLVTLLSAYGQQLACKICSPQFLQMLLGKLLSDPLLVDNPFEREMPPDDLFRGDDVAFSSEVNIQLKGVIHQVMQYCSNTMLVKALGEKIVKMIPELGTLVELNLNKIGNSVSPVLPLLIVMQFLYKVEAKKTPPSDKGKFSKEVRRQKKAFYQEVFFDALSERRSPALTDFFRMPASSFSTSNSVEEKILGKNKKELENLFAELIPAPLRLVGATDAVVGCTQSLYKMFREELTLKLLLVYVLKGVEASLEASTH